MKPKRKLLLTTAITALSFAAFLGGCKKDNYVPVSGICPLVVLTDPANAATSVALNKVITVTFNEAINPATITQASFVLVGTAPVTGTIVSSGSTATFTPSSPLTPNTTYTGRITTAVKDLMGNALQTDYVWTFSTGTTLSPVVISTDPYNNAVAVVLNKTVTATFNMPMNATTINATTFILKQGTTAITGTVSYVGTTASFVPSSPLSANSIYTATITTGAKNPAGTALANNYVWTFTTGTLSAPLVISTSPANGDTGVALNKIVTATFNVPMDSLTITGTTFTLYHGLIPVTGTVTYLGYTASFTPTNNLLSSTLYTATITTGAKNLAGTPLTNNYVWSFTTVGTLGGGTIVNLGSVARFGIIAGVGVSNQAGPSVIHDMDVGIYPGFRSSVVGFPPATIVNGAIYAANDIAPPGVPAMLLQAKNDLTAAYLFCEGASSPAPAIVSGDQGGLTLAPGIYKSTSTLLIQSGNLTLDAQGDANAVWIFQIASDFTTVGGAGGSVILSGGAQAKNVFWQVGSSATIGDYTSFQGNILALTSITMNSHATAVGRMLARNGSVVMTSTNIIIKP